MMTDIIFWSILGNVFLAFGLALIQVSVSTLRTIVVTRGKHSWAAVLAFLEVGLWLTAVSQVTSDLNTVWNVAGYSVGYAVGTMLGIWAEKWLAIGHVNIQIVSLAKGLEIAQKVRQAGYGATQLPAQGRSGPVQLIEVVTARKQVADILRLVNEVDTASFVTIQEARQVVQGYPHPIPGR
jgi:uncharacterized protein YebE (UPF0316 family)